MKNFNFAIVSSGPAATVIAASYRRHSRYFRHEFGRLQGGHDEVPTTR
jgi:hypothetical protein